MHKIVMHTEKSEENNKNVVSHTITRVKVVQVKKFEKVTGKPRISHLSPKSTVSMPKVLHWSLFFFCLGSLSPSPNYISICQCLMLLDEPKVTGSILGKLWCSENHWSCFLLAFQTAFDLVENEQQAFY